jgi:hypothetical protein
MAPLRPGSVFVMNPAYADEISRYVRENGWTAEIVIVRGGWGRTACGPLRVWL